MRFLPLVMFFAATWASPIQLNADDTANIVSKILGSFQGTSSMNLTHFFTSFDMPTCLKRCMPAMDNIGALMESAKEPETMKALCANLTESSKCATAAGCNGLFVGAMSNAFQFMCMDNIDKVSSQLACIQESAGDIQQECEGVCSVQADVIEKAAKNHADQLFDMKNMCNATTCLAHCYEEKLPKYCEIGEDNVIDTIFSQLEQLQEQPGLLGYLKKDEQKKSGVAKLIALMMPNGCDDEQLKIKIPKKIPMLDKPKAVGTAAEKVKNVEVPSQKTSANLRNETSPVVMQAKAGNLSSAAMMINGKVQTLQCQVLDSRGNPQSTPDFESLSKILSEHFNKKSPTPSDRSEKEQEAKSRPCRAMPPQETKNSFALAAIPTAVVIVCLKYL